MKQTVLKTKYILSGLLPASRYKFKELKIHINKIWLLFKKSTTVIYRTAVVILAFLAAIFTITSGVLTLQNSSEFASWFNKEFQTEQYWLSVANSLAPEVSIELFDEKLGEPAFTSKLKGLENRTYVNEFFYTQAFVAEDGTVRLFSITSRKDTFNPDIPYIINDDENPYRLGKVRYGDFRGKYNSPIATQYIPGFRRSIYSEMYYYGNPGNYLYYFLTKNDAGFNGGLDLTDVKSFTFKENGLFNGCDEDTILLGNIWNKKLDIDDQLIRAHSGTKDIIPNTITVTDRSGLVFCEYKDILAESPMIILGPNLDKIRLLRD